MEIINNTVYNLKKPSKTSEHKILTFLHQEISPYVNFVDSNMKSNDDDTRSNNFILITNTTKYFSELRQGNIKSINGIPMTIQSLCCDFCNIVLDKYTYCYDCKKNYCKKCTFSFKCKHKHVCDRKNIICDVYICDICDNKIIEKHYSKWIDKNELICINVCMSCSNTQTGKLFIKSYGLKQNKMIYKYDIYDFGSLLDWIPIISDLNGNYLLYNINEQSRYYNFVSIACKDKDNKYTYHIIDLHTYDQSLSSLGKNILDIISVGMNKYIDM